MTLKWGLMSDGVAMPEDDLNRDIEVTVGLMNAMLVMVRGEDERFPVMLYMG